MTVNRWTNWGTAFPDATTTGLRTNTTPDLPDYNDPATTGDVIIKDGQEITGKTIWGRIKFAGAGRLADNIIKGPKTMPSGQTGVIDLHGKRGGLAIIEDNLIDAQFPNHRLDGIVGHQFRAYRNRLRGVIDGFGTFTKKEWCWDSQISSAGWEVDAEMLGNWMEESVYYFPDDNHSDGPHQDGWQHQGGRKAKAVGNRFSGFSKFLSGSGKNPVKPWLHTSPNRWANGGGTLIQDNVGGGLDLTVRAEKNWYEGWLTHANLKNGGPYYFGYNKHSTNVAIGPSAGMTGEKIGGYWIRLQSRANTKVDGLKTNTWWNGPNAGKTLVEPRASGIHFDS
jgi:hypothetical protein